MTAPSPLWRRWASVLDALPEHHAQVLGTWLPKLALAVGPLRGEPVSGEGEPDGISGLSSRGSYERLVMSEWAVAEVAPDEFVRRAAMGEHLFLHRATRVPEKTTCTQVWIDAGPEQLGSPRLAHIALLIVLAERAEAAGVAFRWGVLQEPDVYEGLEPEHLVALMGMRTVERAGDLGLKDFVAQSEVDDLWWIGGPEVREALGLAGSMVEVEDVLDPGISALDLRFGERTLRLELPSREVVVSLLRNPLAKVADTAVPSAGFGVSCSPTGSVLLIQKGATVTAFTAPKKHGSGAKVRDRVTHIEGTILATGWARRRAAVLVLRDGALHLDGMDCSRWTAPRVLPLPADFVVPLEVEPCHPLLALPRSFSASELRDGFLYRDAGGQLWALVFSHGEVRRITGSVLEVAEHQHSFKLLLREDGQLGLRTVSQHHVPDGSTDVLADLRLGPIRHLNVLPDEARLAVDHYGGHWGHSPVLFRQPDDSFVWHRETAKEPQQAVMRSMPGWTLVGALRATLSGRPPTQWFALSPDRRQLRLEPTGQIWNLQEPVQEGAFVLPGKRQCAVVWSATSLWLVDPEATDLLLSIDLRRV